MLTTIKLLHTLIWAILATSILSLPALAMLRRLRCAAILSGMVLLECAVLAFNGGRCPLTDVAARVTDDRAPNFDIYLPTWLAQHNKVIFGVLFVAGEMMLLGSWLRQRQSSLQHDDNVGRSEESPEAAYHYHFGAIREITKRVILLNCNVSRRMAAAAKCGNDVTLCTPAASN